MARQRKPHVVNPNRQPIPASAGSTVSSHKISNNWRDHPLAIAAVSASATALLFISVVIPIWNKAELNKIENLRARIEPIENELKALRSKHDKSQERLKGVLLELESLRKKEMFSGKGPYPVGYDKVKVGDPVEKIKDQYGDHRLDDLADWASISLDDSAFFSRIVFYKSEDGKEVSHISFNVDVFGNDIAAAKAGALKEKIVEFAGNPNAIENINGRDVTFCWVSKRQANLQFSPGDVTTYIVFDKNHFGTYCAKAA